MIWVNNCRHENYLLVHHAQPYLERGRGNVTSVGKDLDGLLEHHTERVVGTVRAEAGDIATADFGRRCVDDLDGGLVLHRTMDGTVEAKSNHKNLTVNHEPKIENK